jgi:hypothetical protein
VSRLSPRYAPADADALAPLLESIAREIAERRARLSRLEERVEALRASPFYSAGLRELEAEVASHRRELRHCHDELERLGCSLVGTTPLTIRIPTRSGGRPRSRVWRSSHGSGS